MKKVYLKDFLIYNIIVFSILLLLNIFKYEQNLIKYFLFDTTIIKFQDLLTVLITILSIFVGAIITVATVLVSMCDKRIIKLIKKFGKINHVIDSIKVAIVTGILSIVLLALVYSNCDFKILFLRFVLIYISGLTILMFINRSRMLIKLVISLLNNSFGNDDIIEKPKLKDEDKFNKNKKD